MFLLHSFVLSEGEAETSHEPGTSRGSSAGLPSVPTARWGPGREHSTMLNSQGRAQHLHPWVKGHEPRFFPQHNLIIHNRCSARPAVRGASWMIPCCFSFSMLPAKCHGKPQAHKHCVQTLGIRHHKGGQESDWCVRGSPRDGLDAPEARGQQCAHTVPGAAALGTKSAEGCLY